MADITPQYPGVAGSTPTVTSCAAGGDAVIDPTNEAFILLTNGSGGSLTATIVAQATTRQADGAFPAQTLANQAIAVPAGAARVAGPFPAAFHDSNGKIQITYSGVTSLTIQAFTSRRP